MEEKGGFKIIEDINEFHEEPVFDEMFSLLRNFLSPYVGSEENAREHIKNKVKRYINDTVNQRQIKSVNCTHNISSSNSKHQDYVQVWFMMHLPKKAKDNDGTIDGLLEHFFDKLVHNFESELNETETTTTINNELTSTQQTTVLNDGETRSVDVQNNSIVGATNEVTVDFHTMPETDDSTLKTTDENAVNVYWNVDDVFGRKRRRSIDSHKHEVVSIKRQNRSSKRIKRDVQVVSVAAKEITNKSEATVSNNNTVKANESDLHDTVEYPDEVVTWDDQEFDDDDDDYSRFVKNDGHLLNVQQKHKARDVAGRTRKRARSTAVKKNPIFGVVLFTVWCKFF